MSKLLKIHLAILLSALAIYAVQAAAPTAVQWGATRSVTPWAVCVYDSANLCQNVFTLAPTGGSVQALSAALAPGGAAGNCLLYGAPSPTWSASICGQTWRALSVTATNTLASISASYSTGTTGGATIFYRGQAYTDHDAAAPFTISSGVITWSPTRSGITLFVGDPASIVYSGS